MRIAIVCNDTRGGVQPYVALGAGLKLAGQDVRIVAPESFASMVAAADLKFAPLSQSHEEMLQLSAGAAERGTIETMRLMLTELPKRIRLWTAQTLEGCVGSDLLLGGIGGMLTGLPVAEKLGVPFIQAHLQPIGVPTSSYPGVLVAGLPIWWGNAGRRLSHFVSDAGIQMQFQGAAKAARRDALKLSGPAKQADPRLSLFGFSPLVVPMPPSPNREVTGYWTGADSVWSPPRELETFLAASTMHLVSLGFGSMTSRDSSLLAELAAGAAADSGVRLVLLSGWAGLNLVQNENVLVAESVPHQWLFPRMSAVVHHGGAGTTGAAFIAGVPQVVVPFAVDQPFWASRVQALGVGPTPIARKRLTRERLATAIRVALADRAISSVARRLGDQIADEQGVVNAVPLIQDLFGPRARDLDR